MISIGFIFHVQEDSRFSAVCVVLERVQSGERAGQAEVVKLVSFGTSAVEETIGNDIQSASGARLSGVGVDGEMPCSAEHASCPVFNIALNTSLLLGEDTLGTLFRHD